MRILLIIKFLIKENMINAFLQQVLLGKDMTAFIADSK